MKALKEMRFTCFSLLVLFFFCSCVKSNSIKETIPIHDNFRIISKNLGETRIINVWKPEGYETTTDSLPVLYMLDGGIEEDFPHMANTISKLIKSKKIPPMLLVGIENTQRRRDLTGVTEVEEDKKIAPVVGGSEKFRSFINEELFIEINKRYRITSKKGIIGESLAGLFVVETLFLNPEMFDYYIAFDPSLWWNNHYLVRNANKHFEKLSRLEAKFWFVNSDAQDISIYARELKNVLQNKEIKDFQWSYSNESKEKHSTIFRATKEKALLWSFGK